MMDEEKRAYIERVRVAEIDSRATHPLYHEFREYLDEYHRLDGHYYRFCNTFFLMTEAGLPDLKGLSVLETGSLCPITMFLGLKGAVARGTSSDLRYSIDADDNSIDVLISFEVVEHLKDQSETSFDEVVLFQESGIRAFAQEATRVIRPGGNFFLTTPNACSLIAIMRAMSFEPPFLYRPHVREYTKNELVEIFTQDTLTAEFYRSHYSCFEIESSRSARLDRIFGASGFDSNDRGDLHFFKFVA